MLPPFYIRNLRPSNLLAGSQDTLVRINAPCYDETISRHPAATLRYYDEDDGDLITLGSSKELTDKLEEPVALPSSGLPINLQHISRSFEHHILEIDDHAYVQRLWQELQGSSKDSEGVTAQGRGDAIEWSLEKKNALAIFYEREKALTSAPLDRRKAEIWSPIAQELGVTWESVDAMHWALGENEMARRAHECNPHSERSGSFKEATETSAVSTYNAASTHQFEDHRAHYFNVTRPPQVRLPMPVSPQPSKAAELALIQKALDVEQECVASSITGKDEKANHAVEEKGQAQAASEDLRSRMTVVDSLQSRRASHKPSTSAFLPASTSLSPAFDGPGLTSEGKRQAQVAGDKLRSRANPLRQSRPSRVGALEHAISKNRWSSYSGTRAARFDERQDAQDRPRDPSITAVKEEVPQIGQQSLLEVFEVELARKISAADGGKASENVTSAMQNPVPEPAIQANLPSESQAQPSPQGSQALLGRINEHLHELTAGNGALSQDFPTVINRGIRGLGACMQSIARGLQEISSVSHQAADRTRNTDLQLIDDAVLGFQSLLGGFIATLGSQMATNRPVALSAPRSGPEEVEAGSSSTTSGSNKSEQSKQYPSNRGDNPSKIAYNMEGNHATAPSYSTEMLASPQLETENQPSSAPTTSEEPQHHRSAPIRLANRPGYVDHLRQSQSVKLFDEDYSIQRSNSPPLDIHFPTLAQFSRENFAAASTFPALPNMQALVPERAPYQHKYGTKAEETRPANGSLQLVSVSDSTEGSCQSHVPVIGRREHSAQRDGHEVVPLSRLSSAARLAKPFDPLEVEPSAQPHLTEGLRRNATIASTDIRRATRRRRPYSDIFDGSGRVPWGTFMQDNGRERRGRHWADDGRGRPLGVNQEHPRGRLCPEAGPMRLHPAAAGYEDQHHDDSTVGKINDCVEQLRDLGFGGEHDDFASRLLIYAQAADGVLVDAIDLINEEQRAWQRL